MTFEEWAAEGHTLAVEIADIRFRIGEWANTGLDQFGIKDVHSVAEHLGWSKSTLRVYSWVASQYPPEKRTHDLSFTHYQIAGALDEPHRSELLARAARDKLSGREMRSLILKPGEARVREFCVVQVLCRNAIEGQQLVDLLIKSGVPSVSVSVRGVVEPDTKRGLLV